MKPKETATIWVEWGYELHALKLDAEDWADIKAGKDLYAEGDGYEYEGGEFSDTWHFTGGIGGELRVTYCGEEEGSEGEGYIGSLTEDMIEIHGN
ncbi:MAG: hypothetical protein P1U85_22275 [Verrucomicrobiales bacterium]|nr:hypothetical protein [Verrucomicrobiales bacterium]